MVELRPSMLKLEESNICPTPEDFEEIMCGVDFRYVDLLTKNEGSTSKGKWINNSKSVAFELRAPSVGCMAELVKAVGRLKPTAVDYMHSCGDQCIVYWMHWELPAEDNGKKED